MKWSLLLKRGKVLKYPPCTSPHLTSHGKNETVSVCRTRKRQRRREAYKRLIPRYKKNHNAPHLSLIPSWCKNVMPCWNTTVLNVLESRRDNCIYRDSWHSCPLCEHPTTALYQWGCWNTTVLNVLESRRDNWDLWNYKLREENGAHLKTTDSVCVCVCSIIDSSLYFPLSHLPEGGQKTGSTGMYFECETVSMSDSENMPCSNIT